MNELPRKIIDCFLFNDELDVLELRLESLSNYVNLFILVESSKTFRGEDKPFYYEENRERFKDFSDKILYIKVEDMSKDKGKDYPAEAITDTIHYLHRQKNLAVDDLVYLSDVSEVPEMVQLKIHLESSSFTTPSVLNMKKFKQNYKKGTVITTVKEILSLGSVFLLNNKADHSCISNGRLFNGE